MPYVRRRPDGTIAAMFADPGEGGAEFLPQDHPDVRQFLGLPPLEAQATLAASDVEFVRVLDDLLQVMLQKNILDISDLPDQAYVKMQRRQALRHEVHALLNTAVSFDDKII